MIRAVMAEFQLKGFATEGKPAYLMAQANSEDRHLADQLAGVFDSQAHWFRIARTVGEKDPVRFEAKNFFCRSGRGNHPDFAVMIDEQPQNVLLDSVIESRNAMPLVFCLLARFAHLLGP